MKPAPFRYVAAETVDEVVAALAEHGDEAKVLAGGQSLVPLMNLRLAVPGVLVDVNRVAELGGISVNGTVEVGAVTRQAALERSVEAQAAAPLTGDALRHVAFPGVRSRGTVGGSIAHADPASELCAVLLALGGEVVARGPSGVRTIAADDLFVTYFTTALAPDEVLTHVRFPKADRTGFAEVSRKSGDFALAGAAVALTMSGDVVGSARIALFGVADRPVRATGAEQALAGRVPADAAADAGRAASQELEAKSDGHASAGYRRQVVGVVVRRALEQAGGGS
ncbi:MAG: xanthine dehydrogenase family protein subunit M [Gaiellales bacterium]